jgi:hypothetical protein
VREKEEVLERFHELRSLKLKERKEIFLSKIPRNCVFNVRVRVKEMGHAGFCQNPQVLGTMETKIFVCNSDVTCVRCRAFICRNTEKSVEDDFDEILCSPSRCGQEYPKLAMLIWFLQEFDSQSRWIKFRRTLFSFVNSLYKLVFFKWW